MNRWPATDSWDGEGAQLSRSEQALARRTDPAGTKAHALERIERAQERARAEQARKELAEQRRVRSELESRLKDATARLKEVEKRGRAAKPKAAAQQPAGFNAVEFHRDLMAAAKGLGIKRQAELAKDAGVPEADITNMRKGLAPTLATVLLLCDWAGMNPLQYLVRLAPGAANDASAEAVA